MRVRERVPGVFQAEDGRLLTRNLVPGQRLFDEELLSIGGVEYRGWNPRRSKLAAALLKGLRSLPVAPGARVLYLGAANGATASHVSDIVGERGLCIAVEFSVRAFRDLVQVAERRPNILPVLADAARPERYARIAGPVDALYQDVAQRAQGRIFARNAAAFPGARQGLLIVKARSVDVAAEPRSVYDRVAREVQEEGHKLLERVDLAPFERDHAALAFELGNREGGLGPSLRPGASPPLPLRGPSPRGRGTEEAP